MLELIHKIFSLIDWKIKTPTSYGWFHILSIIIMLLLVALLTRIARSNPNRVAKKTLVWFTVVTITFEIIKQVLFTHTASEYQWYAFPFQFCSTPMYIALLSLVIKNQKIKDALYSFLAFYGFFAGLIVMIIPNDVFTDLLMIDIQTMVHHGGMVVVATALIFTNKVKIDLKGFLKATCVFISLVTVALIANVIVYKAGITTLNMFFISPYGTNHFPILSTIQQTQPYIVFLLCYIVGFGFAAFIMLKIGQGLYHLNNRLNTKKVDFEPSMVNN